MFWHKSNALLCCKMIVWPILNLFNLPCWQPGTCLYATLESDQACCCCSCCCWWFSLSFKTSPLFFFFSFSADLQHAAVLSLKDSCRANVSDLQLGPRVQLSFLSPNFAPNRPLPSDRMWEESNRSCLFASDRLVWIWLVLAMQFPNALPYLWNTWSRKFKICAPRSPLFEFILLIFLIPAQIRVNRLYLWVQLKLVKNKNECKPITPDRL